MQREFTLLQALAQALPLFVAIALPAFFVLVKIFYLLLALLLGTVQGVIRLPQQGIGIDGVCLRKAADTGTEAGIDAHTFIYLAV